jgi:long-chain acyl-CoA synthetase
MHGEKTGDDQMNLPRTVGDVLRRALDDDPERIALITRSGELSYRELDALANRAARALQVIGLQAGDRIAVSLPNDIDILAAFHGAMRIGAVWVGVNQALAAPEKEYIVADSGARFALLDAAGVAEMSARLQSLPEPVTVVSAAPGGQWRPLVAEQDDAPADIEIDPLAPAAIAYTSGTTGYPKGAVHSQRNLLLPGAYLVTTRRYGPDLRKGDSFPLTILNMLVLTTLLAAQACGTSIIMDKLDAREIARWIRETRVTVWNGPPPVIYTMAHADTILRGDLATVREIWSGGADCPETIRRAFADKFGLRLHSTFGLTEMPTVSTIETLDEEHVPGSSGRALPHLILSIQDPDGNVLAPGEIGEICVGPRPETDIGQQMRVDWNVDAPGPFPEYHLMLEYWQNPEKTAELLGGAVLHTGDVGSLDAAGELTITDRLNLVLNRGGANVYPAEVERVVLAFVAVESAGVLGLPDERLGQRIGMLVQFKPGHEPDVDGLIAHCRHELAPYKVPEYVAVVDEFPRNAMGKIIRSELATIGQRVLADAPRVQRA